MAASPGPDETSTSPQPTVVLAARAAALDAAFGMADVPERLSGIVAQAAGPVVFTTSFGLEDQVLTHFIATAKLPVIFATLDTGRLFPEVYALWQETEERYGILIRPYYPRHDAVELYVRQNGINGFYGSRDARKSCCDIRKVEPLGRALAGADTWLTGLRADQSAARGGVKLAEADAARGLVKASPLIDWSRERTLAFAEANDVPINPLHAQGFVSIGCQPCTRAIRPGEPERAGRWWWEDDAAKECGLHVGSDGKLARAKIAPAEAHA
ncbi:phosphoadenylyl-sulfate reductase [Bosea sp. SSUT16]|uniref:Adenosine 5'-phosphosulfate reductase n=1 Tax=Bosea spartocytisi TaxID=2773451 RepID=A0A927E506_9HYPH|nr:phosphoadenylyl-sulfate reductase [Bosea spartocytisi]MBD3844896.1 phosphoadenylyl-sulfate reductase [Bosea spartocytisi]MCT4471097.1 phosphoadenylyl-sulfate reductase [Bosea spartocytisi]